MTHAALLQKIRQPFAKPKREARRRLRLDHDVYQLMGQGGLQRTPAAQQCDGLQMDSQPIRVSGYPARLRGGVAKSVEIRISADLDL